MPRLEGSMVAIVTPMKDGAVDLRALRDLTEWQLSEGTDGIVPCGTTGEGATLTAPERPPPPPAPRSSRRSSSRCAAARR